MTHPYKGTRVAFATMHGKDALAAAPFRDTLGARVIAPEHLETDQFGTFSGEVPRTLSPRSAAAVKARLGAQLGHTPYSLASEGSFGSHMGFLIQHHEILLFIDQERDFELVESTICTSPLPPVREIPDIVTAIRYADAVTFPQQRLILRAGPPGDQAIDKSIDSLEALIRRIERLLAAGTHVTLEPDFRALHCPTRAGVISSLAATMAARLATLCSECGTPGFGRVDIERGLPCADCAEPTGVIAADILGCGRCPHTTRSTRQENTASPQWCNYCNP